MLPSPDGSGGRTAFGQALSSASLHDPSFDGGEPVIDAMIGAEGKFGFIELRTIAECTSCVALNNIELAGKQVDCQT